MMKEAVQHRGGDGAVAVEDGWPLLEGFVGGEDDGAAFVALADDLEEEIGAALIDGEVADLVEDEQGGGEVFAQLGFERAFALGGREGVDDIDGVGKEDALCALAGGVTECGGEMGFAEADQPEEDDVGFVFNELETEEVLDLKPIDFFRP